jgi:hypothetical protein
MPVEKQCAFMVNSLATKAHPVIFTIVLVAVLFSDKSAKYDWTMHHVAA